VKCGGEPENGFSLGGLAGLAGVSSAALCNAALDLDGSAARKIIDVLAVKLVKSRGVRPWVGPLPPPRRSPPRTLGDALGSASVVRPRRAARGLQRGRPPPLGKVNRRSSDGQRVERQPGAHGNPSGKPLNQVLANGWILSKTTVGLSTPRGLILAHPAAFGMVRICKLGVRCVSFLGSRLFAQGWGLGLATSLLRVPVLGFSR
jgi:hypothetical protein